MNAIELLDLAEEFADELIDKLTDPSEQPGSKQTYFLDNQDTLTKYMSGIQKLIQKIKSIEPSKITQEDTDCLNRANDIMANLKTTITNYQMELMIKEDVSSDEITPKLTADTMKEALETNKTTQKIQKNMTDIAEQKKAIANTQYTHVIICNGQMNLITATDDKSLISVVNYVASGNNGKDVEVYKLTPVTLKKKVTYTL